MRPVAGQQAGRVGEMAQAWLLFDQGGLFCKSNEVVFLRQLFELFQGEVIVRPVKAEHVEHTQAPVIEVNRPGIGLAENHLEQQDGLRHLDPTTGYGLPDLQEFPNQRSKKRLRITEAKFFKAEQTMEI